MRLITRRSRLLRAIAEAERLNRFSRGEIRSERRYGELAKTRQLMMLFAIEHLGMSYSEAGRAMRRDHSTVMWGARRARQRAGQEPWAALYQALVQADAAEREAAQQAAVEPVPVVVASSEAEAAIAALPSIEPPPVVEPMPAVEVQPAQPPSPQAIPRGRPIGAVDALSDRRWWEENNTRFVRAMRAVHPEREVRPGVRS